MTLAIKAVRGALWTSFETGGHQLISFFFYIFLARLLGPSDFGTMALAVSLLFIVEMILRTWIMEPLIRLRNLEPAHLDTAFWIDTVLAAVLAGLVVVSAQPIASFFGQEKLQPVIIWLVLALLLKSLVMVKMALLQREMRFRMLAIRSLLAALGGGAVGLWMAFSGYGVMSLVGREITNATIVLIILWGAPGWRPGFQISWRHFREIFDFGKHMLASGFVYYLSGHLIIPLISYFLGNVSAGLFNVAKRITTTTASVNEFAINRVTIAAFSRVQDEPERLLQAFYKSVQFTSLVWFPIFFGLSSIAPEMTSTVLGAKWLDAIPLIQLVVLSGPARSVIVCSRSVLVACNKPRWLLIENIIGVTIYLAVMFVAVQHGLLAAAIVFAAQSYVAVPVKIFLIRKVVDLDLTTFLLHVLKPVVACTAMVLAVYFARPITGDMSGIPALAFLIAVGAMTYGIAILVLAPASVKALISSLRSALSLEPAEDAKSTQS